jgi:hypothetical protein
MSKTFRHFVAGVAVVAATSLGTNAHARPGPDVTYQDVTDISNHGAVGGVRAYSLGTSTCNMGTQNLLWTNYGTPAVGFNMYRYHNGRLVQIGLSFCKTACCAAAGSGCGLACNGQGGPVLGAGCRDVYGSGWNAIQSHLAPRSAINPYSGAFSPFAQTEGNAIFRRLQVPQSEMSAPLFPGAMYFVEGVYVGTDDAQNGNAHNNASYRRVTVNALTFDVTLQNTTTATIPAIRAWRDHGLGTNLPDPSVTVFTVDVPNEGRFWVATKVTELRTGGPYLYDYAIFNLNSHASGGSFSIPMANGVKPSSIGFHDVNYHSSEVYSGTDWTNAITTSGLTWSSPETFAENPNSNALRWGTMYNFWFEADTAPTMGQATLGLFRPNTPQSITIDVPIPGSGCTTDWNADGIVNSQDFFDFIDDFFTSNADYNSDGVTNSQDFFDFVNAFFIPC